MERCENLKLLCESVNLRAIGFLSTIGVHISKNHECAEWLIDSTYKTNSSNFELFAIIEKVFGFGFPSDRLFLRCDFSNDSFHRRRIDTLR